MDPVKSSSGSAWSPFAHTSFAVLWVATVISNIGTWMHDVGAGWLMTELSSSPLTVAAVQAATTFPVFLFALIAGAVADIVDRRKLLIIVNLVQATTAAALASLVSLDLVTPLVLIVFTFALGTGAAFVAPAWQAIVPSLVPRSELSSAIALNSMGINISRAIGPAIAGFLIVSVGLWSPFALNAVSFVGIIAALLWWRPAAAEPRRLPAEEVSTAVINGLRFARYSPAVRATLLRSLVFFLFASAFWAMLPLIARVLLSGGPTLYGLLLACVGVGAVGGAFMLPVLRKQFGPSRVVAFGTLGIALSLAAIALLPVAPVAIAAALFAGLSWILVLSTLNHSAQTALPDWARARGLSIFLTVFFGSMFLGSLAWGQVASIYGIPSALLTAAGGALVMIPLTARFQLQQLAGHNLAPSMHWPAPVVSEQEADLDRPVMVEVAYSVMAEKKPEFLKLMDQLANARRRNGGYGWRLLQDAADPRRMFEIWHETSWTQHLRHHERVSEDDHELQDRIKDTLEGEPEIKHLVAPFTQTRT
ncbi:MAG: MFS transporter [Hyphomicrobium sp.]|nr:MFS transporter [Hyphomicrobium sp.]